jgi:hypothetical protein
MANDAQERKIASPGMGGGFHLTYVTVDGQRAAHMTIDRFSSILNIGFGLGDTMIM